MAQLVTKWRVALYKSFLEKNYELNNWSIGEQQQIQKVDIIKIISSNRSCRDTKEPINLYQGESKNWNRPIISNSKKLSQEESPKNLYH